MTNLNKPVNIWPWIILGAGVVAAGGFTAAILLGNARRKQITCNSSFLFVGDSNTVGASSYANQLKNFCPAAKVSIVASVGANTNQMLQQMHADLASGRKYDVVVIFGGSNDLGTGIDTKGNLQAMYTMGKNNGATVVAITPPSKKFIRAANPGWGGSESNYQNLLAKLADLVNWINKNNGPDVVIDFNKITSIGPQMFTGDLQHANSTAHAELLAQLARKLRIK